MSNKNIIFFYFCLIIPIVCGCESKIDDTKILVIGDVQLKSDLSRYNKDQWIRQTLNTSKFNDYFQAVIKSEKPDYIFQMGDWVNYNNNLFLNIVDTTGNELDYLPLPYDEWEIMNKQIPDSLQDRFYMAIGNHESYKKIVLQGIHVPDVDILANVEEKEFNLYNSNQKKELLVQRFPHLDKATFHNQTGSYAIFKDRFTLVSIDGLDKNRDDLIRFIENQLLKHKRLFADNNLFVISHYPLFTGRKISDDEELVFRDIRDKLIKLFDQYKVDLYINGHEHFYLRYKKKGFKTAQFKEPIPNWTKFITVSNFCNPYPRELERVQIKENNDSFVYFNGVHYSVINITNSGSEFRTYGLVNDSWKVIDSLKLIDLEKN